MTSEDHPYQPPYDNQYDSDTARAKFWNDFSDQILKIGYSRGDGDKLADLLGGYLVSQGHLTARDETQTAYRKFCVRNPEIYKRFILLLRMRVIQ